MGFSTGRYVFRDGKLVKISDKVTLKPFTYMPKGAEHKGWEDMNVKQHFNNKEESRQYYDKSIKEYENEGKGMGFIQH